MTKKIITSADGKSFIINFETTDDKTVVKFDAVKDKVSAHSKSDSFGRKIFDEIQLGSGFISRQFEYVMGASTEEHTKSGKLKSSPTTQLVSRILLSDGRTIEYEYDAEERITKVIDSVDGTTEYTYDALGQLLTERLNGHIINSMTYDTYGNIISKNGKTYSYDSTWHDLLKYYDGYEIEYDDQGNPTKYLGHNLTWEKGRQLKSYDTNTYTYNANGIRTSKTINNVKHEYTLDGTKILKETWDDNTLIPLYDNEDSVCGIIYNDYAYYFLKNLQGDVIAITNNKGKVVASYTYDAWGACTIVSDNTGIIARINPFRYRGYYYDVEIGLYYLQSRYYDPQIGRFINGDEPEFLLFSLGDIFITNLFSYCNNSPILNVDYTGTFSIPRSAVAFVLDIAFMAIPAIGALLAPVKTVAKSVGKAALKVKLKTPLLSFIRKVAQFSKKIIECLVKAVSKIPIWGKRWAAKIPVQKLIAFFVPLAAGASTSFVVNSLLNVMIPNIDLFLSLGGAISGILDWLIDGSLDGKITI